MNRRILASSVMMSLMTAVPALAAGGREDNSGIVVWIFLGFCALIVIAQLVPALFVALGLVKGIAESPPKATLEEARENARH